MTKKRRNGAKPLILAAFFFIRTKAKSPYILGAKKVYFSAFLRWQRFFKGYILYPWTMFYIDIIVNNVIE